MRSATITDAVEPLERLDRPESGGLPEAEAKSGAGDSCFHCGTRCAGGSPSQGEKVFCCQGCLCVFEILSENGLTDFYKLSATAGVRVTATGQEEQFRYLDEPSVRERLVNFSNEKLTRVTFRVPSIHCIACVWLLENLFRLNPGIGEAQVNFPRKDVVISFGTGKLRLSEVVALLTRLGYEPELNLSDLESGRKKPVQRRLWLQLGMAGFAFGNIMLFSISSYLGLDTLHGPALRRLFGWLSLALATPVVVYSAQDYSRSSLISLRQKLLTIDVPIAAGIAAIYLQSVYEVIGGHGEGYFDSLTGLIFFLLCGRWFQQKTFDRLAFDRDYRSFFPLSVNRLTGSDAVTVGTAEQNTASRRPSPPEKEREKSGAGEERVSLSQLTVGDRLSLRNGELIPADSRLVRGRALVDYSFVTGEAEPAEKQPGAYLYAGGRSIGGSIIVETTKPVSQGYLTSLWNQEAFRKEPGATLDTLTNRYSQRFTKIIIAIAISAGAFWLFARQDRALKAAVSVLIVACPCALALAAPFTLGTAVRLLGRRQIYLKGPQIIESLSRTNAVVFDKTGTLTGAGAGGIRFEGDPLNAEEKQWLYSLARQSTHPFSVRIAELLNHAPLPIRSFQEIPGQGIAGTVACHEIRIGSAAWLSARDVQCLKVSGGGSVAHVAINGEYRGHFALTGALRPEIKELVQALSAENKLALLSGDNEKERVQFAKIFGAQGELRFSQSPLDKLEFIRDLQSTGKTVLMVGDGLNDAGALQQSNVGVAVVENTGAFSPASDIIMSASMVPRLAALLRFSKNAVKVVRLSFMISSLYNVVGISIAASGLLSPIVCAILMPLSSVTVVAFSCGATAYLGRRANFSGPELKEISA